MLGVVPGIHVLQTERTKDVDGRDKPGHDENHPRTHQQCFSGNSTVPLGRYCRTYQLAQRR